ncbi:carbohydrate ABC transporter permease [Salinibacillus xinjiangensis]|uniref:ABC transporter permease subunit n=1 Tax=Salinibacillus xinjiangensis TaxID=1229268 RepID=A0A6G1XAA4_9BACI|nr:carbohydrate ABC transporter permease [Salinibacillus xinjiangensis]MRG87859.1 ABC transporter permease subunit [Salinibacillus xinjiangensis]
MMEKYTASKFFTEIIMIALAILFIAPIYLVFTNAFKSYNEVLNSTASLPSALSFDNFVKVWEQLNFPVVFMNTLIITVVSVAGILLISSMASYRLVRSPGKVSNILFFIIISAMIIPFQTMMIPLVKVASDFNMIDSIPGIIMMYFGFGVPLAVFLYHGFIKGIPLELEEAAAIDGCGPFRTFFKIVFPLLKPITTTIGILHTLWVWNDFLLPYLMLSSPENQTISLASYVYFGQYMTQWNYALAALTLAIIPVLIMYLFLQKNIIEGISAGAVKG